MDGGGIFSETRTYEETEASHKPKWLGQDRLYRWNMLRIQLNDSLCKSVLVKLKSNDDIISCLKTESNISESFLNDPGIENAGSALQRKFGHGNGLLLNDYYFLFGMPRVVKIFGNAYKNVDFEGGFTTKEEYDSSIHVHENESKSLERDFSDFGVSYKGDERNRLSSSPDERNRLAASRDERNRLAASRDDRNRLAASRDERNRLAASHDDRNRLAASRDERNRLAASRKPGDLGVSSRTSNYEEMESYRKSKRETFDDYERRGNEDFSEFRASSRRQGFEDAGTKPGYARDSEYESVIRRRERDDRNEEELRRSRRREYDSGVEAALWHLDKTLDEHD